MTASEHPAWGEAASDALWLADRLDAGETEEAGLMMRAASTVRLRAVASLAEMENLPGVVVAIRAELAGRPRFDPPVP